MKGALAIFAKTPGVSPAKTRLAAEVGAGLAENFYRLSLEATEEVAGRARDVSGGSISPVWALAEPDGGGKRGSFPAMWTGSGDLGERLHFVYETLLKNHDYVIMIGADCPQLEPSTILEAAAEISEHPGSCVVGPCPDGGFYLFGAKIQVPKGVWTGVAYSTNRTLLELRRNLGNHGIPLRLLPEQSDVDAAPDLDTVMRALGDLPDPSPAQRRLLQWLRARIGAAEKGAGKNSAKEAGGA